MQQTKVAIAPDVLYVELANEIVLLNPSNEHYYGLDEIGARVWKLLLEHGDPASVVAQMLTEYDIDEVSLHSDVTTLIAELERAGLLVVKQATES